MRRDKECFVAIKETRCNKTNGQQSEFPRVMNLVSPNVSRLLIFTEDYATQRDLLTRKILRRRSLRAHRDLSLSARRAACTSLLQLLLQLLLNHVALDYRGSYRWGESKRSSCLPRAVSPYIRCAYAYAAKINDSRGDNSGCRKRPFVKFSM